MTKVFVVAVMNFILLGSAQAIPLPAMPQTESENISEKTSYNPAALAATTVDESVFYRSVVALRMKDSGGNYGACLGVLFKDLRRESTPLNAGFIMTSGHCTQNRTQIEVKFFPVAGLTPISRFAEDWEEHKKIVPYGTFVTFENAHIDHDISVVYVKNLPTHYQAMGLATNFDPIKYPSIKVFTITRHEFERNQRLSALYSIPMYNPEKFGSDSNDMDLPGTSLIFRGTAIQPRGGSRGSCQGDSGAPTIAVWKGTASLIGPHRSSTDKFSVPENRECGRTISYYNASFYHSWILEAMQLIADRQAKPFEISRLHDW